MGYSVDAYGTLTLKQEDEAAAVAALRAAWREAEAEAEKERLRQGAGYSFRSWGWTDNAMLGSNDPARLDQVLEAAGFDECFRQIGAEPDGSDVDGPLHITCLHGQSMDTDAIGDALAAVAPWCTGEIECRGEDDTLWRWKLENGVCMDQAGRVEYDA